MKPALLLDLDDTLIVDDLATAAAFSAAARLGATRCDAEPAFLASAADAHARELWRDAPVAGYGARIGMSAPEGLWCGFEGAGHEACKLREWAPSYRREVWRLSLGDQGVEDAGIAEELAERYCAERRARQEVFPDVAVALGRLREDYVLGLITNGASCLQREKLVSAGLEGEFEAVVVSGDLGVGKPDREVFEYALTKLKVGRRRAVMVGDSIPKDVNGALAAGLDAVWLNRTGCAAWAGRGDLREVTTLEDLPTVLAALA